MKFLILSTFVLVISSFIFYPLLASDQEENLNSNITNKYNSYWHTKLINQLNQPITQKTWIKSVQNEKKQIQSQNLNVMFSPQQGNHFTSLRENISLLKELAFAYEVVFDDKRYKEYFDIEKNNSEIKATIKPKYKSNSRLQSQIISLDSSTQKIKKWQTQITTGTWIYDSYINVDIDFNSDGTYKQHLLKYENQFSFIELNYQANITGKVVY